MAGRLQRATTAFLAEMRGNELHTQLDMDRMRTSAIKHGRNLAEHHHREKEHSNYIRLRKKDETIKNITHNFEVLADECRKLRTEVNYYRELHESKGDDEQDAAEMSLVPSSRSGL